MRNSLVVGASGFVGGRLMAALGGRGVGTYAHRQAPGLVRFDFARERLTDLLPRLPAPVDHVFVVGGTVNPDQCARDPDGTGRTNVTATIELLSDCLSKGIVPVYLSSDYVYDGTRGGRSETDPPCPTTEYGRQKADVERWLGARTEPWIVARLSKVVSGDVGTHSVLGQWMGDILAGKVMRSATDQVFSPAFVDDVARALVDLADGERRGLFNVAGDEPWSRYGLNRMLLEAVREIDPAVDAAAVLPCRLAEIPFVETRPLDTSLSTALLREVLPWRFRSMRDLSRSVARQHLSIRGSDR